MSILISDFDGTLTRYDFFDLVRKRWPVPPEDDPWEKFVSGQITHFQALAEIFARIRTSEADLLELANSMELDSSFAKSAGELQERRWEIVIASAGCDWYIRFLLNQASVSVLLYAKPGSIRPQMRPADVPSRAFAFFQPYDGSEQGGNRPGCAQSFGSSSLCWGRPARLGACAAGETRVSLCSGMAGRGLQGAR